MITTFAKEYVLPIFAQLIRLKQLIVSTKEPIVNVFYHTVSNNYLPHISPLYKFRSTKEFEQDIDFLLNNFEPISAHDVLRHVKNEKRIEKPSFHLSFDDGLRELFDNAMPVLSRKGVPATVFVNSDFVDNRDLFFRFKAALIVDKEPALKSEVLKIKYPDRKVLDDLAQKLDLDFSDFLHNYQPYLSTEQLKKMQENGFTIGAHSASHPNYELLTEQEQIEQTLKSYAFVKEIFSEQNSYFAFPFSADGVGKGFFEKIYNEVDLTFGTGAINSSLDGKHIDRINMEIYGKTAKQCVQRAYMTKFLKQWV